MDCIKYKSKIGDIYIEADENFLYRVSFKERKETKENAIIKETIKQLEQYFSRKRKKFNLPLKPIGSDFQKKVWSELLKIPYSKTKSYQDIASSIGNINACRAVGNANNKNPIAIIIPCHRVISKNGKLSDYAGGKDKKDFLLKLEQKISQK